jgi:hypothetical protein
MPAEERLWLERWSAGSSCLALDLSAQHPRQISSRPEKAEPAPFQFRDL